MKQSASDVERDRHPSEDANIVPPNVPVSASSRWEREFATLQEVRARYSPGDARYSDEFLFWLDAPDHWPMSAQYQRLAGWCVGSDGRPPSQVRCKVGNRIFCAACVYDRPDVAQYLGLEELPLRCGFVLTLEVPSKTVGLEIEVRARDGRWAPVFSTTVCGSPSGPEEHRLYEQWRLEESAARYVWRFDRPQEWVIREGPLYICGWCVDRTGDPIAGVRVRVGPRIFQGKVGIQRRDIRAIFPHLPFAHCSGFGVKATLHRRTRTIILELLDAGGQWHPFFRRDLSRTGSRDGCDIVSSEELENFQPNGGGFVSRFALWIEPLGDWARVPRYQRVAGWCVALHGPPITEIRAHLRGHPWPAIYGILRPEVRAAFPDVPSTLHSGFLVNLQIPLGGSDLVLEARSGNAEWEPFFARRLRRPLLWRRGENAFGQTGRYDHWIDLYDKLTLRDRRLIRGHIRSLVRQPRISVLLPAFESDLRHLRRAIESIKKQLYPHWELCAVDDGSQNPEVWQLLQRYARSDSRIKILRRPECGHICAASNDALAVASGEFTTLLDHDDELAPTALYFIALELNRKPHLQFLYSDEDKLDAQGRRCDPYFKPDWNEDLFSSQNYINHLSVYGTELMRKVGGFRKDFEGSQDYDLIWRCLEQIQPEQIQHIPHILYHWRMGPESTATSVATKPYAHQAAIRAVQEHFERMNISAKVEPDQLIYLRAKYAPPIDNPLVSIIIPTRDGVDFLRKCIESIRENTDYPNFEIIILDNESRDPRTLEYFSQLSQTARAEVHKVEGEFNFSRLNNIGVRHARGSFIALLNNDLEVKNSGWLTEMISHAARPGIGAVGARLWYPDGTMQHGGVILGPGGVATHAHAGSRNEHGYFPRAHLTQNFSAVTGACMLVRKELYEQLGGLDEANLAVTFNDVDFCLRLAKAGYRIVWTPHAELYHHESASRGLEDTEAKQKRFLAEVDFMRNRWTREIEADPCYNPNLSIEVNKAFTLAFPPRVEKPWKRR
jgi:GT2 family glycosyltransferase